MLDTALDVLLHARVREERDKGVVAQLSDDAVRIQSNGEGGGHVPSPRGCHAGFCQIRFARAFYPYKRKRAGIAETARCLHARKRLEGRSVIDARDRIERCRLVKKPFPQAAPVLVAHVREQEHVTVLRIAHHVRADKKTPDRPRAIDHPKARGLPAMSFLERTE